MNKNKLCILFVFIYKLFNSNYFCPLFNEKKVEIVEDGVRVNIAKLGLYAP